VHNCIYALLAVFILYSAAEKCQQYLLVKVKILIIRNSGRVIAIQSLCILCISAL